LQDLLGGQTPAPLPLVRQDDHPDVQRLYETVNLLITYFIEAHLFMDSLSQGLLDVDPPARNFLISPFKHLHSNLRHLIWQTKQVAKGDLSQRVDFLGEFSDAFNSMIASLREKRRIEQALIEANSRILDSIQYAQTIQRAVLPGIGKMASRLSDYFVTWIPKDIVSGDMFWFETFGKDYLVGVMDCTGHGVPGALMTMLASTSLSRAVNEVGHRDPARIIGEVNRLVKALLNRETRDSLSDDGMDIGLCAVDGTAKTVTFAGARIDLYVCVDSHVRRIRGDKQSAGYRTSRTDYVYRNHAVSSGVGSRFYMSTDGLIGQIGGPKGLPFGRRRFAGFMSKNDNKSLKEQQIILADQFSAYRAEETLRDDVTVIGFAVDQ
jgi:phosphoserine phosphatase RsbU/P